MPETSARKRRVHLLAAALLAAVLAAFEFASEDRMPDLALIRDGASSARGGDTQGAAGLASKLPAPLPPSQGRTFHISQTGSDEGPGSGDRPWRTLQRALDTLAPGDRALVRGGTYTEDLTMTRAGTPDAPITVAAQPGETVVLHAASESGDTYPVRISDGAAYFRLQGFVIEGARGISSTNVYLEGDVHDIELSGNEIRFSQDQGVFSERTTRSVSIVGNRIHDNGLGHVADQHQSHGLYIEGEDHLIANNVIYDHPFGFGIQIYPANRNTSIVNNTIVRSGFSGIVLGGSDGVSEIVVRNNIIARNEEYGVEMDDSCPTDSVVDTNLLSGNGEGAVDEGCESVDTSGGNIAAAPLFVAAERGDFRVGAGSAALDRALEDFAPRTDIRDQPRPAGEGADLGAYEGAG